ncbi:hypothetical protein ACFWNN_23205 [Lentzea sp. NPDC058450]|uniref:wHTH domain-containing protein n=1 Tax=Lentzea sp. NPDC058450 TaxID=3346505 RepID=UPI00364668B0
MTELMRVVQIDSAFLRRADRRSRLESIKHFNGGSRHEQYLREQLLGYLLVVAHRTAIDPITLPNDIVDHIGIDNEGVRLDEVLTSIRKAGWPSGRTRVLTTVCTHPATARALRLHAVQVDAVLAEIAFVSEEPGHLKPLEAMPAHASADGLTIRQGDDAEHAPASFGHRFQLADDKIQRLLMGRQLYGSTELAIRELYQNALDACRYRQARTAYLRHPSSGVKVSLPDWTGEIAFSQGEENGRPFLDCKDNGIGMSDRELIDVFATAGVTFTKMPEYLEEQADWASANIECYPNSRFGIGVLSYFMLADEITVKTCRLNREGRPGQLLKVHIAGPYALFRVKNLGQGTDSDVGTTVRLHLRQDENGVLCTDLLRRILWVSDFLVTSGHASGEQTWEPRQLSQMAPIGSSDALDAGARREAGVVVPAPSGVVWWCDTEGAVLADGLWAGTGQFGAIVNLTRASAPRLTVDRKTIIDLDRELVGRLLQAAIPALLEAPESALSHSWLSELSDSMPRLADEICERAIEARFRPWRIAGVDVPIEVAGCFPSDAEFVESGREARMLSKRIGSWRLSALHSWWSNNIAPVTSVAVVPARPSDEVILSAGNTEHYDGIEWLPDEAPPSLGHILSVAHSAQLSPAEVAARLDVLGHDMSDCERLPLDSSDIDPVLLSKSHAGTPPWLLPGDPVTHDHVILSAIAAGITPDRVVKRLEELGFRIPSKHRLPSTVHPSDRRVVRPVGIPDGALEPNVTIPVAHILIAATASSRTPAEVTRRLDELGYSVPSTDDLPNDRDRDDVEVFVDAGAYVPKSYRPRRYRSRPSPHAGLSHGFQHDSKQQGTECSWAIDCPCFSRLTMYSLAAIQAKVTASAPSRRRPRSLSDTCSALPPRPLSHPPK